MRRQAFRKYLFLTLQVRFLEAQNRKLNADLEMLRGRWGKDTSSIKIMYEGELTVSHLYIYIYIIIQSAIRIHG